LCIFDGALHSVNAPYKIGDRTALERSGAARLLDAISKGICESIISMLAKRKITNLISNITCATL